MEFFLGLGLSVLGVILFVLGVFTWHSAAWAVLGFLLGLIGIIALKRE